MTGESKILLIIKKGDAVAPPVYHLDDYLSILISEVVLNAQLTTDAKVVRVISSQEGNLTIDAESVRDRDTKTCFTGEFSLGVNTVFGDDSRTSLDIVRSSANFTLVTNVNVGGCSGVVIASPTCIGLDIDVRTG